MHIVFVGLAGVPRLSRACDVRLTFFANLLANKYDVTILNRYSSSDDKSMMNAQLREEISTEEIINPRVTSGIISKLLFVLSVLIEPIKLFILNKNKKIDIIHIYSNHYFDYLLYWFVSRLIGSKVIAQYVEYRSEHKHWKQNLYHKINSYLCDYKGAKLWDGFIPISNFLKEKALEVNPNLKWLLVTPLCDFKVFDGNNLPNPESKPYLFYCGNVGYEDVINLIIEAYKKSEISNKDNLVLVLSGKTSQIDTFRSQHKDIKILSRLDYNILISYYKHADGLFIPLKPVISEIARFPNKVCEYLASYGLIITTNVGEMNNYFQDGVNAIVADNYSSESISQKLDMLASGKYDVDSIKKHAYQTGINYFDINSYKDSIFPFFESI